MTAAVAPPSPVEYVSRLSPDDKHAVLLALLREAMALNGDTGLLPVEDEDGRTLGIASRRRRPRKFTGSAARN
jgi:hypothetical protein